MKLRDELGLDMFMETSAKTGMNSKEIFTKAGLLLYGEYSRYKAIV
jgi:hypothetical protein